MKALQFKKSGICLDKEEKSRLPVKVHLGWSTNMGDSALDSVSQGNDLPRYVGGGYTVLYFVDAPHDSATLCAHCATDELRNEPRGCTGQARLLSDMYWEGPTIYCDNCNAPIESSYGDPEEEEEREAV